eukprot:403376861
MFTSGKRQSEHEDLYSRYKLDKDLKKTKFTETNESQYNSSQDEDPFQSIKEGYNIDKKYEIYLETEKKHYLWLKKFKQDPMESVADKIRKAQDLNNDDLKTWVTYNFLAFPQEEQEKIKALIDRQVWFWRRAVFIIPPLFYGTYAIVSYQSKKKLLPNIIISGMISNGYIRLGLYSSNNDIKQLNQRLYNEYKDEVVNPKYRGLKLYKNKKVYQIDNREFTSSNFDDLKQLVNSQRK